MSEKQTAVSERWSESFHRHAFGEQPNKCNDPKAQRKGVETTGKLRRIRGKGAIGGSTSFLSVERGVEDNE